MGSIPLNDNFSIIKIHWMAELASVLIYLRILIHSSDGSFVSFIRYFKHLLVYPIYLFEQFWPLIS